MKSLRQNGFTLLELMVVVSIIGVLSSVAIPKFNNYKTKAMMSEGRMLLSSFHTAQEAFYAEAGVYGECLGYMGVVAPAKHYFGYGLLAKAYHQNTGGLGWEQACIDEVAGSSPAFLAATDSLANAPILQSGSPALINYFGNTHFVQADGQSYSAVAIANIVTVSHQMNSNIISDAYANSFGGTSGNSGGMNSGNTTQTYDHSSRIGFTIDDTGKITQQ